MTQDSWGVKYDLDTPFQNQDLALPDTLMGIRESPNPRGQREELQDDVCLWEGELWLSHPQRLRPTERVRSRTLGAGARQPHSEPDMVPL